MPFPNHAGEAATAQVGFHQQHLQPGAQGDPPLTAHQTTGQHERHGETAADGEDRPDRRAARPGHEPGTPGAEPTNWGSAFSGSAWEFDERSGEYFLHMFSPKQPELNWENVEVRQAIYEMMRWWVDRGVDGFRMDVINLISKPAEFRDGEVPAGQLYHPSFVAIANGPRLDEFLAEMNTEVGLDRLNLLTVGEMPGS